MAGGRYEERPYHSIGSGSIFAKGSLKKLYTDSLSDREVVMACMQALYDAADDDSATGGPDVARQIYPVVGDDHRRRIPPPVGRRVRGVRPGRGGGADEGALGASCPAASRDLVSRLARVTRVPA